MRRLGRPAVLLALVLSIFLFAFGFTWYAAVYPPKPLSRGWYDAYGFGVRPCCHQAWFCDVKPTDALTYRALGVLLIFIVKDPHGFELCLVSSETFDPSVRAATDYSKPDWEYRAKREAETLAAVEAEKRKGQPEGAEEFFRDEL